MSKGDYITARQDGLGAIGHSDAPNWDFLYEASTIKHPKYNIGDRVCLPDGRVFRYCKCGTYAITSNKFGVANLSILVANKITDGDKTNAVAVTNAAAGVKKITVTFPAGILGDSQCADHDARDGVIAEDDLRGWYISLYTGVYREERGIIGNSAVAADDTSMVLYLDAALDHELSASTCEILANPYANVGQTTTNWDSIMGVPTVMAAIGEYFWIQTWGPLRISGTTITLGQEQNERQFVFAANGVVIPHDNSNETMELQHAGFLIERTENADYSAAPFINLQINP